MLLFYLRYFIRKAKEDIKPHQSKKDTIQSKIQTHNTIIFYSVTALTNQDEKPHKILLIDYQKKRLHIYPIFAFFSCQGIFYHFIVYRANLGEILR